MITSSTLCSHSRPSVCTIGTAGLLRAHHVLPMAGPRHTGAARGACNNQCGIWQAAREAAPPSASAYHRRASVGCAVIAKPTAGTKRPKQSVCSAGDTPYSQSSLQAPSSAVLPGVDNSVSTGNDIAQQDMQQQRQWHQQERNTTMSTAIPPTTAARGPPGWMKGLIGIAGPAAAAAAAATTAQDVNTATDCNSSTSNGSNNGSNNNNSSGLMLPLPLLLQLPRQLQQLASGGNKQSPDNTTSEVPPRTQLSAAQRASSPLVAAPAAGELKTEAQRTFLYNLALALQQLPNSSASKASTSSSSHSKSSNGSSNSTPKASNISSEALHVAQLLQQLCHTLPEQTWQSFAEGVRYQAAHALRMAADKSAAQSSIASLASKDGWGSHFDSMCSTDWDQAPVQAAADRYSSGDVSERELTVSGGHVITVIPNVGSIPVPKQEQQQEESQELGQQQQGMSGTAVDSHISSTKHQYPPQHVQRHQRQKVVQSKPTSTMQQQQQEHNSNSKHQGEPPRPAVNSTMGVKSHQPLQDAASTSSSSRDSLHSDPSNMLLRYKSPIVHMSPTATTTSSISEDSSGSLTSTDSIALATTDSGSIIGNSGSTIGVTKYEYLVFGGGGARCFAYAGALHALRQLGLLGKLKGVSGSSGGAVYALLAALKFSVSEVQSAMGNLPETENLSWLWLNSRLGLSDGEATFKQIELAISAKLGVENPTLADVAAAAGCSITLAATSLARRAPVYLNSKTKPDMLVRDALRASCAIPFFFTPLRGPEGDLLVDGCISDCTPLAGLAAAGEAWDPAKTLVLAVHDAAGLESPDFQGLLVGLISTCMQAGFHHTAAAGIDLLNLWPAAAGVNPLQFRLPAEQARDVVAASQALAEEFAVNKMKSWEAAAARAASSSGKQQGLLAAPTATASQKLTPGTHDSADSSSSSIKILMPAPATSLVAGMGSGSCGSTTASEVLDYTHAALVAAGLHNSYSHTSERVLLQQYSNRHFDRYTEDSTTDEDWQVEDVNNVWGIDSSGDEDYLWNSNEQHGLQSMYSSDSTSSSSNSCGGDGTSSASRVASGDDAAVFSHKQQQQQQQHQEGSTVAHAHAQCAFSMASLSPTFAQAVGPSGSVEVFVRELDGISQVCLVSMLSMDEEDAAALSQQQQQWQ